MLPRMCSTIAFSVFVLFAAGCSRSSVTTPTPPAARPIVAVGSMTIVGERPPSNGEGYTYRVVMHLRETAGVNATIMSVDLTFMNGAAALMTAHHAQLIPAILPTITSEPCVSFRSSSDA
jgi:hypothetical protein